MAARLMFTDFSRFDVVNAHGDNYLMGRKWPLLRTFHGAAVDEFRNASTWRRKIYYSLAIALEWRGAAQSDRVIGVSIATQRSIKAVKNVVPCGVDTTAFFPGTKSINPSILFVGTEEGRKRGRWFADLFTREILPGFPDAELIVVSDGQGAQNGVSRRGRVTTDELANLYREAWVFCLPSTYEGFGVPYIEAMASGTAVVATTGNPGASEVLANGEFGAIIPDGLLAESLRNLLSNQDLRDSLAGRGMTRSREYSWDAVASHYEAELTKAIANHRAKKQT